MSDSIFTYKITFSMRLKILALFLLISFTIFIATIYSYSAKVTISCLKRGYGVNSRHLIIITANMNSTIIYKNHSYKKYILINNSDMKIINNALEQNISHLNHTINFKIKTIFGIQHKHFTYRINNVKTPVTIYAIDSYNNTYPSNLNKTNKILTTSDSITFNGTTFPFTSICINSSNSNESTVAADNYGHFEIPIEIEDGIYDFSIKFQYKNLKPTKVNYAVKKIIQN